MRETWNVEMDTVYKSTLFKSLPYLIFTPTHFIISLSIQLEAFCVSYMGHEPEPFLERNKFINKMLDETSFDALTNLKLNYFKRNNPLHGEGEV